MGKISSYSRRHEPLQERSRQMVEWILESAYRLFTKIGYVNTTTNKIADLAGISIGSFYYYFPSKEAVLVELGKNHRRRMHEEIRNTIRNGPKNNPKALIKEIMRRLVQLHREEPLLIAALADNTLVDRYLDRIKLEEDANFWSTIEELLKAQSKIDNPARAALLIRQILVSVAHGINMRTYCGKDEEIAEDLSRIVISYLYK
jgi:AcrR family transcriptional regulator